MDIHISFHQNWIYADGGIHSFTVARVIRAFRALYGDALVEVLDSYIDSCTLRLQMSTDAETVTADARRILSESAQLEDPALYRLEIDGMPVPLAADAQEPLQTGDIYPEERVKPQPSPQKAAGKEAETQPALRQEGEEKQAAQAVAVGFSGRRDETRGSSAAVEEKQLSESSEEASSAPGENEIAPVPTLGRVDALDQVDALERIDALAGLDAFKALCHEIADRADLVHEDRTEDVFFARTWLFVINSGEGLSNALELLTGVLTDAGYFDRTHPHDVRELEVPSPEGEHAEERFLNFMGSLDSVYARERVVCYDITAWLGHTQKEPFRKLLLRVFREKRHCVNIFRMPVQPERLTRQTLEDLADVLTVEQITFAPRTAEETRQIAGQMLAKYNITVAQNAWEIFDRRVTQEKQDGGFYGVHTLRKLTDQMVIRMEEYNSLHGGAAKTITPEKLVRFDLAQDGEKHGEEKLASLVGMEQVKKQLRGIVNQIMVAQSGAVQSRPGMHMCFVGAPGTGKTTVARIVGEILADRHLLKNGRFYEYRGRDLCGRYVGETAIKTREICREAYGSVLFIDEAYSLFRGDHSTVDFGREAIDTLIAEMENHAEELVVILAGYSDDMETMLTANAGMNSRIPYTLEFPNYSRQELYEIFRKFIPDTMEYDETFADRAKRFFEKLPQNLMDSRDFGNGRFARNLYERTWGKAVSERMLQPGERIRLTAADLEAAGEELLGRNSDRKRPVGF